MAKSQIGFEGKLIVFSSITVYGNNSEEDIRVDEIAEIIADSNNMQTGNNIQVYKPKSVDKRRAGVLVDNQKLKSLGWSLKVSMDEGIRRTVQSYLNNE